MTNDPEPRTAVPSEVLSLLELKREKKCGEQVLS